ncbi:hypothetical protein [Saccharothrix xinjiangensis]|uniref:DUF3800 domain-containing protein n=1 Tax=Saccharothrix xinjiangensis TaxID=204798 RepID=A0ABV9Y2U1_9PSEU
MRAFVDVSRRNDTYYLGAALVDPRHLAVLRKRLRELLLPGQRELHFQREKPQRRKVVLSGLVKLGVRVDIYRADCRRGEERARQVCPTGLVDDLLDGEAHRRVLDSRAGRDELDAHTVRVAMGKHARDTGLTYEHFDSTGDPCCGWPTSPCGATARAVTGRAAPMIGSVIRLDQL